MSRRWTLLAALCALTVTTAPGTASAQDAGAGDVEADETQAEESDADEAPLPEPTAAPPPPASQPRPAQPAPAPAVGTGTMAAPAPASTPYSPRSEGPRGDDDFEDEEEEDEGDPYDFLWIELFGGVSYVDLRALSETNFYPEFVRLSGTGPMGGGALGFRIEFVSIGVRATVAHYDDQLDVGTAMAEIMLAIPIPIVKPYLRVGFGLGWHGDGDFMAPEASQTTVFGFAFNGTVGLDVYLVDWFAIGAAGSLDILNMNRQTIDEPVTDPGDVNFSEAGDAVGIQLRGQLAVSFHF